MENKKSKKELTQVVNDIINENTLSCRARINENPTEKAIFNNSNYLGCDYAVFACVGGYKLKELENNRPLTLLNEKEKAKNDFVCFANIKTYNNNSDWVVFFDITQDKKTISACDMLPHNYSYNDARKDEGRLFIITNPNWQQAKQNAVKHFKRNQDKKELKKLPTMRYFYNDISFFRGLLKTYDISLWGFSHNSLELTQYDKVDYNYLTYKGEKMQHNATTRKAVFDFMIDKSGYFKLDNKLSLLNRAKDIKTQKQREKEEKTKADFLMSDKSDTLLVISDTIKANKNALLKMLNYNSIMSVGSLDLIGTLRSNIKKLQKMSIALNDYAKYKNPYAKIESDILRIKELYIVAITKYNYSALDWCDCDCYEVKNGEVVAKYDWIGKKGTIHENEVISCPINLSLGE